MRDAAPDSLGPRDDAAGLLDASALRIALSSAVLVVFWWALFTAPASVPVPVVAGPGPSADAARGLAESAKALVRAGDWAKALEPAVTLHDTFPQNHIYIDQLATIHNHLGNFKDEARLWEEYLEKAPLPDEACPALGLAYKAQGLEEKARDAFARCVELDPRNPDSVFYLALACERGGDAAKARELYRRGLELSPGYSDMSLGLARLELRAGRAAEAKGAALRVLEKSPDNVDALLVAGLAALRLGDDDGARKYLERGVALSPGYLDLVLALARTSARQGRIDEARREYARALEIEPGNAEAAAGRARLAGVGR